MWRRSSSTRRVPSPTRAAGFTLIELLAALAILSLILALAYGSFFQISGAATSLKGELEEQQELRLLLKMIADDLQSARYLATIINKPGTQVVGESGIIAKVASI